MIRNAIIKDSQSKIWFHSQKLTSTEEKEMNIKGLTTLSLVDWDVHNCTVVYTSDCNYRCPACHNSSLVLNPEKLTTLQEDDVLQAIEGYINYIDGICITGGEPTLQAGLKDFCLQLKILGLKIKVDTNGFMPAVIIDLLESGLIDYVAVDIKAPLTVEAYSKITGTQVSIDTLADLAALCSYLIKSDFDYEFRTTIVPGFHTPKDIEQICKYAIKGAKKYAIQLFRPCSELIDPSLNSVKPFTGDEIQEFLSTAKKYISNVLLRSTY